MSNQIKVTVTIIIAVFVAYTGYRFMEGLPIFGHSNVIYTHYKKVNGLSSGAAIYISGVEVGTVKDITLQGTNNVKVALSFSKDTKIMKGSIAKLESSGLLGNKAIYIVQGNGPQAVPSGGTIEGVFSQGMLGSLEKKGTKLADNASQTFSKLNQILEQLKKVVDKENRHKIDKMLAGFQQASTQLAKLMKHKRVAIEQAVTHANHLLANLDTLTTQNAPALDSTLTSLKKAMQNFQQISKRLVKSNKKLNNILSKINNGKGSLGKLVNDPSLYNNLDSLSVSLTRLVDNINKNPTKYLKGVHLIDVF